MQTLPANLATNDVIDEPWVDAVRACLAELQAGLELLHSEITVPVSVTATSAATAVNVINPGAVTYDGTPIMLEFFSGSVTCAAAAGAQVLFNLWDGNTDLGYWGQSIMGIAASLATPVCLRRRLTPTAGAHNYNIRAWQANGNGTVAAGTGVAGGYQPAFLRAVRVR